MNKDSKIYIAGHKGLVGSALLKILIKHGFNNLIYKTKSELDLTRQDSTKDFFSQERPDYVIIAAAKVGGILANSTYPADFYYINAMIHNNIIHHAHLHKVKRLIFMGSSCVYPKDCHQPIKEEYLLNGTLEPTNEAFAIAKISGIKMCQYYNEQYNTQNLVVMSTNLYGPNDNYDLNASHVIPALIRKFHEAKLKGDNQIELWGTGISQREFLYSDDLADACLFLLNLSDDAYKMLIGSNKPPLINVGMGKDITIKKLAETIAKMTGYKNKINWDASKPDGTRQKLLDASQIQHLGWKHSIELDEGLNRAYEAFLETDSSNI